MIINNVVAMVGNMNKNPILIAGTVVAAVTMVASLKSLFAPEASSVPTTKASYRSSRESSRSSDDGFFSNMAAAVGVSAIADSFSNTVSNVSDYCSASSDHSSSYSSSSDYSSASCDSSGWS